jgi:hypothetical protein
VSQELQVFSEVFRWSDIIYNVFFEGEYSMNKRRRCSSALIGLLNSEQVDIHLFGYFWSIFFFEMAGCHADGRARAIHSLIYLKASIQPETFLRRTSAIWAWCVYALCRNRGGNIDVNEDSPKEVGSVYPCLVDCSWSEEQGHSPTRYHIIAMSLFISSSPWGF